MKPARRVMLLEFNELTPDLMDRFMAAGHLPNFQRLYEESQIYVTEAEEEGWDLNPWVQWVTVHSGVNYRDHGITELDEGCKLKSERVWDIVSQAGLAVWVCGSMNVAYRAPINGLVMPDPWTTKVAPCPDSLLPFFRFVQTNVLEHTAEHVALDTSDYLRFTTFMIRHGLSVTTIQAIVRQLLLEQVGSQRWKRAALLDKLQFDVFRWYYQKTRPHFSTFFSNSTAHYQHYYWREMEPSLFKVRPKVYQRAGLQEAILFGYQEMDKLIPRFLSLAGADTVVLFATAISQQPCLIYEDQGGKVTYRPTDFSRLMSFAGVTEPHTIAPVMAEVFNIHVEVEDDATRIEGKLRALRVGDRQAMHLERRGRVIGVKCRLHETLPKQSMLIHDGRHESVAFFDLFYQIEGIKSGMHHRDGMLWIRMPEKRHQVHKPKIPLAAVAPTMLELLSIPSPPHMKATPIRL